MRSRVLSAFLVAIALFSPQVHARGEFNARIVRVTLPDEDATAEYVETAPFTVRLRAKDTSVQGVNFYVGNGAVAVELRADPSKGFIFQGKLLAPPHVFKKGSTVKVLPGYKRVDDLAPGTVYVILSGVTFDVPETK